VAHQVHYSNCGYYRGVTFVVYRTEHATRVCLQPRLLLARANTVNSLGLRGAGAEKIFQRALKGYQKALGPKHPSTLEMVNNLGLLYANIGGLEVAKKRHRRALEGYERALDQEVAKDNIPALNTAEDLVDPFKTTSREEKRRGYIHAPLSVLKRFSGARVNAMRVSQGFERIASQCKHNFARSNRIVIRFL